VNKYRKKKYKGSCRQSASAATLHCFKKNTCISTKECIVCAI